MTGGLAGGRVGWGMAGGGGWWRAGGAGMSGWELQAAMAMSRGSSLEGFGEYMIFYL